MSSCSDKIQIVTSCWPPEVTEIGSARKANCFIAARPLIWAMTKSRCRRWSRDKGRWLRAALTRVAEASKSHRVCWTYFIFEGAACDVKSSADARRPARGAAYGQAQMKDKQSRCGARWYMQGKYAEERVQVRTAHVPGSCKLALDITPELWRALCSLKEHWITPCLRSSVIFIVALITVITISQCLASELTHSHPWVTVD